MNVHPWPGDDTYAWRPTRPLAPAAIWMVRVRWVSPGRFRYQRARLQLRDPRGEGRGRAPYVLAPRLWALARMGFRNVMREE